ncbi:MAG: STAS domain-containing protein [Gammaproteobacteria bacterium]
MGKSDNKSRALGDDPLAWLNAEADANKKTSKKKLSPKTKKPQKTKPEKNKSEKASPKKAITKKAITKKSSPKKAGSEKKNKTAKATANTGSSTKQFVLESSLIINNASDIYESLKKLAACGHDIEIDASKVEIIDSAILQLFFSFVLNLQEKNIKLTWYKPTEGLLNKASTLGLSKQLGF